MELLEESQDDAVEGGDELAPDDDGVLDSGIPAESVESCLFKGFEDKIIGDPLGCEFLNLW